MSRTIEDMCRDLLDRCGIPNAQQLRSSDIVELGNLVAAAIAVRKRDILARPDISAEDRRALERLHVSIDAIVEPPVVTLSPPAR